MKDSITGGVRIVKVEEAEEREQKLTDINQICKCFFCCVFWEGVLEVL